MTSTHAIYKANATYVVRASGGIIAETRNGLILAVNGQDDIVFFPDGDVAMPLFDESQTVSSDPSLGDAHYFHLAGKSGQIDDVAWQLIDPKGALEALKNHIAFDVNKVAVEAI